LVIVFSPTGHTKQIATYISEIKGSDLNELIPEIPYTAEDLDYNTNGTRANNEQNDPNARPEIATEFSLDGYDRIYIGYPIWW
jgi:flavodoxin